MNIRVIDIGMKKGWRFAYLRCGFAWTKECLLTLRLA